MDTLVCKYKILLFIIMNNQLLLKSSSIRKHLRPLLQQYKHEECQTYSTLNKDELFEFGLKKGIWKESANSRSNIDLIEQTRKYYEKNCLPPRYHKLPKQQMFDVVLKLGLKKKLVDMVIGEEPTVEEVKEEPVKKVKRTPPPLPPKKKKVVRKPVRKPPPLTASQKKKLKKKKTKINIINKTKTKKAKQTKITEHFAKEN